MSTFDLSSPPVQFFRYLPVAAELLLAPVNPATMATLVTKADVSDDVVTQEEVTQCRFVFRNCRKRDKGKRTSTARRHG